MQLFKCQNCGQMLYFENTRCESCGARLGYLPERSTLSALEAEGDLWHALADRGMLHKFCANETHGACNWMLPVDDASSYCAACRHNHTIPDLSVPENLTRWRELEGAKHRLFYSLFKLRLPVPARPADPAGLAFDFLADPPDNAPRVLTGHDNGLVTINLIEADDAEREKLRAAMHEPYRALLGHFRHEVGHFFWDRLVRDKGAVDGFRAVFGDESQDYGEALQRHYAGGAPPDWQERFISAYASSHPWEDFAETWAHYLHIVDTLEMARSFGLRIEPRLADTDELDTEVDFDPHDVKNGRRLIDAWLPLTFAVNSLNRCMGQRDLYPFVLSPAVIVKLGYVHDLIRANRVG
jgi:hypothetical protein